MKSLNKKKEISLVRKVEISRLGKRLYSPGLYFPGLYFPGVVKKEGCNLPGLYSPSLV